VSGAECDSVTSGLLHGADEPEVPHDACANARDARAVDVPLRNMQLSTNTIMTTLDYRLQAKLIFVLRA